MEQARFVTELARRIDIVLRPLLCGSPRAALVDFPNHSNVGDSAIWLGQLAYLRSLGSIPVTYTCDIHSYSREELARRVGDGVILLSGGGNLGDLWEQSQHLRERVIADFPAHRIIQLPQSICFQQSSNLARAQRVFDAHPALTLLLRDARSLSFAANAFRAPAHLCPDMAFALGPLERPCAPRVDLVWLSRTDKESAQRFAGTCPDGAERVDWINETPTAAAALRRRFERRLLIHPRVLRNLVPVRSRVWEVTARRQVRRGCRLLASGRAVLTDRLHGHILSLLLGVPHYLLDNMDGKVRAFYDTWTNSAPSVRWCETVDEALWLATPAAAREGT